MRLNSCCAICLGLGIGFTVESGWVRAQSPPNDGFDWVTVGAPGNRAANAQEAPQLYLPGGELPVGAVNDTYRITRTEITVGQWFQFVQAYAPFYTGSRNDPAITGLWIHPGSLDPAQPAGFYMDSGTANLPQEMSWRMAARYVNWLNNGRQAAAAAFERGAYDTSTFTMNPDHTINDQPTHTPGVAYWIPTLDEWEKAMHYDPNRYGLGQEGYWMYPIGRDTPAISGYPWDGGETDAGIPFEGPAPFLDVASYPSVQSPWGLLDGSGGVREWTEYDSGYSRAIRGSEQFEPSPGFEIADRIDYVVGLTPWAGGVGLRLASAVPEPTAITAIGLWMAYGVGRRRRCDTFGCGWRHSQSVSRHQPAQRRS